MNPWAESLSFSLLRVIFCFFFFSLLLIKNITVLYAHDSFSFQHYAQSIPSCTHSRRWRDSILASFKETMQIRPIWREGALYRECVYTPLRARNAFFSTKFPFLRIFSFSELTPSKKKKRQEAKKKGKGGRESKMKYIGLIGIFSFLMPGTNIKKRCRQITTNMRINEWWLTFFAFLGDCFGLLAAAVSLLQC